jgi:hypothetical protein
MTVATLEDRPAVTGRTLQLVERATAAQAAAQTAEAWAAYARQIVGTAFVPASLMVRTQDNRAIDLDRSVQQITAALMTGQELGLDPMATLRAIDVIPPGEGSPALRAITMRGLLQARGHQLWVVETTNTRAVVRGQRAGTDIVQESVWTLDRAKRLGVRGFGDPKGSWQRQPAVMLVARATAEVARWVASDVLLALPYVIEELGDESDEAEQPQADPDAPPRQRTARRSSPRATGKPAGSARRAQAKVPAPEPEGPPPDEPVAMIKEAQRRGIFAGLRKIGVEGKDASLAWLSERIGREIGSTNDLTQGEASSVLDLLKTAEAQQQASDEDGDDPGPPEPRDE